MNVNIIRRTRALAMRISEMYDQPNVALSIKTPEVRAEEVETAMYAFRSWALRQKHFFKLCTVHHQVLLCTVG